MESELVFRKTMEFSPKESSLFRASIDAVKEFLPTAQLRCSAEGVRINGMDGGHMGFVDYFLAAADMTTCKIPKPLTIGVSLAVLARVLANIGSGDKLTLSVDPKKLDRLQVSYTNEHVSKRGFYEIALLNIHEEVMGIPELEYGADVQAKTSDILTAFREVSAFGEFLDLTLDEDGFHIAATGDMGSAKQTLENIEGREMALENGAAVTAKFAAKFLLTILKGGGSLSSAARIEFDEGKPLRASFHYGSGSHYVGYLAPRVAEDL